jgi:transposase InsO family protein
MVIVMMDDEGLKSLDQIKTFLSGLEKNVSLKVSKQSRYAWIAGTLKRTGYLLLSKKEKGIVFEYMITMTGLSRQQLSRLIFSYREHRWIGKKIYQRNCFTTRYTRDDILLLVKTDEYHQTLSGPATKKLFERAYNIFNDTAYERLAFISVSHIYNLRNRQTYLIKRQHFEKTKRSIITIAERKKPRPNQEPGYIRIDTVHQGDLDKCKGVYHINAIDEVTQYEVICSVEAISERYLIPVLEVLLETFPFEIKGFHSDNGSEYINHQVAQLLNKLHIEFTKSRARHSNDNALIESKNGSVIRKILGYTHIPQKWAEEINEFNKKYLVPYINFHRPCFFHEEKINDKGKIKKIYPYKKIMTPYEKLKSLPNAEKYLKKGMNFSDLEKIALAMTDFESAKQMHEQRKILFQKIFKNDIL